MTPTREEIEYTLENLKRIILDVKYLNYEEARNKICYDFLSKNIDTLKSCLEAQLNDGWQDISTAPRDGSKVLVTYYDNIRECWIHKVAFWAVPYAGACDDKGWWCYGGVKDVLLDASTHKSGTGATHWKPLLPPSTKE